MLDAVILCDGVPESRFPTCEPDRDVFPLAEYKTIEAPTKSDPAVPILNSSLSLHEARATLFAMGLDRGARSSLHKWPIRVSFSTLHSPVKQKPSQGKKKAILL